ncbi:unnamed protein product [Allacma fusca]|uniref:Uncharacterized protein n=1 Tax=Allacma fusca TaxID=39272 RepID=A0A8J2KRS6_9HEXA|nr:unnamed protein product [Allacma fusca]
MMASVVESSAATSGSNAEKRPHEGFIDDQGERLIENMLLDVEEEQDDNIDVRDGEKQPEEVSTVSTLYLRVLRLCRGNDFALVKF